MEGLEFYHLVFYFIIYGFFGWVLEVVYFLIDEKRFVNRGFLTSPILPIYGFGALMVIGLMHFSTENIILFFTLSIIATSMLEYVTGFLLEKLFHRSWWDYSKEPFNLHGRICLRSSFLWGMLSIFFIMIVHPYILSFTSLIPPYIGTVISLFLIAIILIDTVWGIIAVLEVNEIEEKLQYISSAIKDREKKINGMIEKETAKIWDDIASLRRDYEKMSEKYIPAFIRRKLSDIPLIIKKGKK